MDLVCKSCGRDFSSDPVNKVQNFKKHLARKTPCGNRSWDKIKVPSSPFIAPIHCADFAESFVSWILSEPQNRCFYKPEEDRNRFRIKLSSSAQEFINTHEFVILWVKLMIDMFPRSHERFLEYENWLMTNEDIYFDTVPFDGYFRRPMKYNVYASGKIVIEEGEIDSWVYWGIIDGLKNNLHSLNNGTSMPNV